MKLIHFTDFQKNITENLDTVNNTREPFIVWRKEGKSVVIIDWNEYNAQQETIYLLSNSANRSRLEAALKEMRK